MLPPLFRRLQALVLPVGAAYWRCLWRCLWHSRLAPVVGPRADKQVLSCRAWPVCGVGFAGKTTLLRTFAGRHRHEEAQARMQGRSCYYDSTLNLKRAFLGTDWGTRTVAFSGFGCVRGAAAAVVRVWWLSPPTRVCHASAVCTGS